MSRSRRLSGFLLVFLTILFSASLSYAQVLVVAPHPDDDILTSAGIVYRAVNRGQAVRVVYMTNGDYNGLQTGYGRQDQAVAAQSYLDVPEDNLIFLGYPDGYLQTIFDSYVNQSGIFVSPSTGQSVTYGDRGLGRTDYHSYRFGSPANYNRFNILVDLEDILSTFLPQHIFVTSEFDSHPDHSTTYQLVRLAVLAVHNTNPGYTPVIDKTIVWWNGGSNGWPNPLDPTSFFAEIPDLTTQTGLVWTDRESIDVPVVMQSADYTTNPKYLALLAHRDGGDPFLQGFIHKDEVFWAENVVGSNRPPIVNAGLDQTVAEGQVVYLDGSQSRDPDGATLSYQWVQRSGPTVQLSSSSTATPSFGAPTGLSQNETLTFELVVSDNQFSSPPDSVSVTILSSQHGSTNIAPLATVTASSETPQTGQTAVKAVDGVIDGYPGDYTREWASAGERNGAWLRLSWPAAYTVSQVVLYDRPNTCDNILSGTMTFSDGSSLAVGPLDNGGAATQYSFPAKVITSLTLTVTQVGSCTANVGLAEIQVFGSQASQSQYSLTVNVDPSGSGTVTVNPSESSYYQGEQVTLTATPYGGYVFSHWSGDATGSVNPLTMTIGGDTTVTANFAVISGTLGVTPSGGLSASGPPGGPFAPSGVTYTLQNTGGTSIDWTASATQNWVGLSSTGGTLAAGASTPVTVSINSNAGNLAAGSYSDTVTFSNLTNGNGDTSRAVSLTIAQQAVNIAPSATVTASSETPQYGQTAVKAVDGVIDGYPGDYTREWATAGEGSGAWVRLSWPAAHTVSRVVLYDRPNTDDNILSGTMTFSDGSSLAVGPLDNGGAATQYSFPAKVITSLTLTVTGVSSRTVNVGLAEIQVFGN